MPIVSYQSNDLIKNITFIASAIRRILIIGSPKDSINNFIKLLLLFFPKSFVPYLFLLLSTSLLVNPSLTLVYFIDCPPIQYIKKSFSLELKNKLFLAKFKLKNIIMCDNIKLLRGDYNV